MNWSDGTPRSTGNAFDAPPKHETETKQQRHNRLHREAASFFRLGVAAVIIAVAVKTARELELEDLLTSARAIAQRGGEATAWDRFDAAVAKAGVGSVTAKVFKVLPSDG